MSLLSILIPPFLFTECFGPLYSCKYAQSFCWHPCQRQIKERDIFLGLQQSLMDLYTTWFMQVTRSLKYCQIGDPPFRNPSFTFAC